METLFFRSVIALIVFGLLGLGLFSRKRTSAFDNARWVGAWFCSLFIFGGLPGASKIGLAAELTMTAAFAVGWFLIGLTIGYIWRKLLPIKAQSSAPDFHCSSPAIANSTPTCSAPLDPYASFRSQSAEEAWAMAETGADLGRSRLQPATIGNLPTTGSSSQRTDDAVWTEVARQFDSGRRDAGLWAKLFAEADGDVAKAKARYLTVSFDRMRQIDEPKKRT
jgi:hypothetical protein